MGENSDRYRSQIFDGNILIDGYCLLPYACKCCTVFKQFDGFNFDGLAAKCQKIKISHCQNFKQYYTLID